MSLDLLVQAAHRCDGCTHWKHWDRYLGNDVGSCEMHILDMQQTSPTTFTFKYLLTPSNHRCLSWEARPKKEGA